MMKPYLLMMLSALSFIACKVSETKPVSVPAGFDWEGHRGCRGLMPENTLQAFMHALEFPQVQTLELDLAVSKDNQLIVTHEPYFNPEICLQPDGQPVRKEDEEKFLIYHMTAAEIRDFDCGSIGHPRFPGQQKQKAYKPVLREVVTKAHAKRPGIRWNMEIKSQPDWDGLRHPPIEEFTRMVVAELQHLGIEKQVTVQSFDVRALQAMHRQAPDIQLAYLVEHGDSLDVNMAKLDFTPAIYSPYYLTASKKLVRQCHHRHMKFVPWTVNDVPSMRLLIRMGVDGIITDYPNLIGEVGRQKS